jgi:hypothetical protein
MASIWISSAARASQEPIIAAAHGRRRPACTASRSAAACAVSHPAGATSAHVCRTRAPVSVPISAATAAWRAGDSMAAGARRPRCSPAGAPSAPVTGSTPGASAGTPVSRRLPGAGAMMCGSDSPCSAHSIAINVGESVQVGRQTTIVYWLFIRLQRLRRRIRPIIRSSAPSRCASAPLVNAAVVRARESCFDQAADRRRRRR